MDEPFSALDVLTAETLRTDFLDLWCRRAHADQGRAARDAQHRGSGADVRPDPRSSARNPGRILTEIQVTLPQPRNRLDPSFRALVERIYVEMTLAPPCARAREPEGLPGQGLGTVLPRVSSNLLSGLMETLASEPFNGKADLPEIASCLQMEIDELFPGRRDAADAALRRSSRAATSGCSTRGLRSRARRSTSARRSSRGSCSPTYRSRRTSAACSTSARRTSRR